MVQIGNELLESVSSALFSLHFRAMEALHPRWVQARPVPKLPRELEPLPADRAAHELIQGLRKLAADELTVPRERIHAHGAAIVGWATNWAKETDRSQELKAAYALLMDGREILSADDPISTYLRHLNGFGFAKCVESFGLTARYDQDLQHTTVDVEVIARRSVAQYADLVDPQNWTTVAPVAFTSSYVIADTRSPEELEADPQATNRARSPWKSGLFEAARMAVSEQGTLTLSKFRNVLQIDYAAKLENLNNQNIAVKYSLTENLTQRVIGIRSLGGIDKDSGHVSVTMMADDGKGERAKLSASKSFRFIAPPGLSGILNWLNPPLLVTWMLFYVVGGACGELTIRGEGDVET